jgi:hypothetical protein
VLPSLCEYISKEPDVIDGNDGITPSFHKPYEVVKGDLGYRIEWLDTAGYLAKSQQDLEDNWTIDLAVPCFGGYCAQDWADFVHGINPNADPSAYTQPIENEHKVFGCDLWVEVTGVVTGVSREIPLYEEQGDQTPELGPVRGHFTYDSVGTGKLKGKVNVDTAYLNSGDKYILVLNGPRGAGVGPGSTNDLLAEWACLKPVPGITNGWDGWWVRQTDNSGATKCILDPTDVKLEGYYNFQFNVTAAQLESGYVVDLELPSGSYDEVQFLVKDETTGWNTVLEYPGVGETNSTPSEFSFLIN